MAGRVLYVASFGNWRGRGPLSVCIDEVGLSRRTCLVRLFRADIWGNKAVFAEVQERNSFICWPIVHPYTERSVPQYSACVYYINRYSIQYLYVVSVFVACKVTGAHTHFTSPENVLCILRGEGGGGWNIV